jgi:hypothetical protein
LSVALSAIPGGYYFRLGYYFGLFMILGCMVLWTMLCFATTTRNLLIFCVLALAHAGFFAVVALRYQAEDRVLRAVAADSERQRRAWSAKVASFNMNPLYEMFGGERPVNPEELKEMNARARDGQAALLAVQSEMNQWEEQAVSRISKVSSQGAVDFRRGVESRRSEGEEVLGTIQSLFTEDEQLTQFLIQRQRHYRVARGVFEFDSAQDAQFFNDRIASITHLREKLQGQIASQQVHTAQ